MLKMHLVAGLAATALMTAAAVAQTTTAPATSGGAASSTMSTTGSSGASSGASQSSGAAAAGQLMTQMSPDMMRGSKLMGTDIYGSDNQKIGDLDDVILDRQGKIQAIVVGVGGFLGIGEKNVAIPYDQVQWMTSQEVQAQNNQNNQNNAGTNTAGGVTTPNTTASGANQPATTGSTGSAGAGGAGMSAGGGSSNDSMPARGMVKMTKADLQNAPEFRFNNDNRSNATGGAAGTNPPANTNRPATAQ